MRGPSIYARFLFIVVHFLLYLFLPRRPLGTYVFSELIFWASLLFRLSGFLFFGLIMMCTRFVAAGCVVLRLGCFAVVS